LWRRQPRSYHFNLPPQGGAEPLTDNANS
jgi:hypothetical protein